MPKNKGKGGKNRRRGKNDEREKRELTYRDTNQEYAQVLKIVGNCRLEAYCFGSGRTRLCHIRGKMRKKVWVNSGDIVLVSLREFQDGKGDVILKYTPDESKALRHFGELPANTRINEHIDGEDEGDVEFLEDENEEKAKDADSDSDASEDNINVDEI